MPTAEIKLRLVNKSANSENETVVIFQKNVAAGALPVDPLDEKHVAWKVIENCGMGDFHPFSYSLAMHLSIKDSWGNFTEPQKVIPGQQWSMVKDPSGDVIKLTGDSTIPDEVTCVNDLGTGAISAWILRSGKNLATKGPFPPKQEAVFKFLPKIFVGIVAEQVEGDVMKSVVVKQEFTELDLTDLASADINWTGGGGDENARAFQFSLANKVSMS